MALPRLSMLLALALLPPALPSAAQSVADPAALDLKVTPGDDAALKADASLHAPIVSIDTGLRIALETDPGVVSDPLTPGAPANANHESLGFSAAWAAPSRARLDLSIDDALDQTWAPLSLFSTANHEVDRNKTSAQLGLTVNPLNAIDLSFTGDAAHAATRDSVSDALYAPAPSLYSTDTQGAAAGLTWRLTSWFTLDAKGRAESTDAEWRGAGGSGITDARLDYSDLEPSVDGALTLPWSDKLAVSLEHAVSPLDPQAFSSFAAVSDRDPSVRFGPGREWRYRVSLDQSLAGVQLNAAVTQAQIESATELGPVGDGLQAPVSVYGGQRQEVDVSLKTPLTALGLPSMTLTGVGAWRDSQVRDPFTGELRRASAEVPQTASLGVVHDSEDQRTRWGLEGHFGGDQTLYQMSQVTQVRIADSVDGFIEYTPGPFALRLQVDGLYGGDRDSTDFVFAQPRGLATYDPIDRVDSHIAGGQAVRLMLRKTL